MAIYVNTNVGSLHGRNTLNKVNHCLDTTYQRLSSGLRINSAQDDAAGLQIADRMTSQINGLSQANRNASDGIALLQTMEGALDEYSNMAQRLRTLTVQAANGTNTGEDKVALATECYDLLVGMKNIAETTKFGGVNILNGHHATNGKDIFSRGDANNGTIDLQIGANSGDTITFTLDNFGCGDTPVNGGMGKNNGILADLASGLKGACGGTVGGTGGGKIEEPEGTDKLSDFVADPAKAFSSAGLTEAFIASLDKNIGKIDAERANIGATINRLESTIRSQENTIANQSDARSRIRDTDFAAESANLSQQNIIQQAATSMLMQANARPQLALSLLG